MLNNINLFSHSLVDADRTAKVIPIFRVSNATILMGRVQCTLLYKKKRERV